MITFLLYVLAIDEVNTFFPFWRAIPKGGYVFHRGAEKRTIFVIWEIIWHIFVRGIWHIDAHFNPNDHKASLRIDQLFFSFVTRPSPYSHFACPLASRFIA